MHIAIVAPTDFNITSIAHRVLRKTVAFIVYNFNISLWDEKLDKMEGYRYLDTYPKKGHEGYMRVRLTPRFGCDA
ncbi:hypothetical protein ColLi_12237 [Colletotrichum liriopes]|uniref:Uncharacterized protein n=1 Tax=Colletotrichum liriopes TaxID=708192 RepID=A0AA37GY17_9PEZI|nr:hypothetical protein ColLi_12237 [Colletotrichum liriopes]